MFCCLFSFSCLCSFVFCYPLSARSHLFMSLFHFLSFHYVQSFPFFLNPIFLCLVFCPSSFFSFLFSVLTTVFNLCFPTSSFLPHLHFHDLVPDFLDPMPVNIIFLLLHQSFTCHGQSSLSLPLYIYYALFSLTNFSNSKKNHYKAFHSFSIFHFIALFCCFILSQTLIPPFFLSCLHIWLSLLFLLFTSVELTFSFLLNYFIPISLCFLPISFYVLYVFLFFPLCFSHLH